MRYTVIKAFTDLKDNNYIYRVGDEYPRHGLKVNAERAEELSGKNNRQGIPLIEPVSEGPTEAERFEDFKDVVDYDEPESSPEEEQKPHKKIKRRSRG
jgi:hypothetical protein